MEANPNINFQAEKLHLIQLLLNTENPSIINEVRKVLTKTSLPPLSEEDIIKRANESEIAIKEGRTLTIEQLEKEVNNWE